MQTFNHLNLCDLCFNRIEKNAKVCPYCDGAKNLDRFAISLPEGTVLAGRYRVGKVLGKGGFGITYLCYDLKANRKVAVKEYLPDSLAFRTSGTRTVNPHGGEKQQKFHEGAQRFYEEAAMVSAFKGNPNIIGVYELFRENNTIYFVMEYLSGMDLKTYLSIHGKRSEGEILYIANQVSEALMTVHDGNTLHRDIAPDNIFLCEDGTLKVIDFGAARHVIANESNSLSVIIKNGFAPMEQYQRRGHQGPWTDIYALGATLYFGLMGEMPDDAPSRLDAAALDFSGVSSDFARIIEKMMAVHVQDRYQSVRELRADLAMLPVVPIPLMIWAEDNGAVDPSDRMKGMQYAVSTPDPSRKKSNKWLAPVLGGGVGLAALAAAVCIVALLVGIPFVRDLFNLDDNNIGVLPSGGDGGGTSQGEFIPPSLNQPENDSSDSGGNSTVGGNTEQDQTAPENQKPSETPSAGSSDPSHTHSYGYPRVTKPASCSATGIQTYYCDCGATKTETIPVTDHFYNRAEVTLEPTLTAPGTRTYYCACGASKNESIDQLTGVDWRFSNGTLTIFGNGPMDDYQSASSTPWYPHINDIRVVNIEYGVTAVGESSFFLCENLCSVAIPSSVTEIHPQAFAGCKRLADIYIPENVTKIGARAFYACSALTGIAVPHSVNAMGESVFENCSNLESVTLSQELSSIEAGTFAYCTSLRSIVIPSNVTSIGSMAFGRCRNLRTVTVQNSRWNVSVHSDAFLECSATILYK